MINIQNNKFRVWQANQNTELWPPSIVKRSVSHSNCDCDKSPLQRSHAIFGTRQCISSSSNPWLFIASSLDAMTAAWLIIHRLNDFDSTGNWRQRIFYISKWYASDVWVGFLTVYWAKYVTGRVNCHIRTTESGVSVWQTVICCLQCIEFCLVNFPVRIDVHFFYFEILFSQIISVEMLSPRCDGIRNAIVLLLVCFVSYSLGE